MIDKIRPALIEEEADLTRHQYQTWMWALSLGMDVFGSSLEEEDETGTEAQASWLSNMLSLLCTWWKSSRIDRPFAPLSYMHSTYCLQAAVNTGLQVLGIR